MKFMYVNFHLRVLGETDLQLVILITPVEEKTYFLLSFPYVTIGKRLIMRSLYSLKLKVSLKRES